MSGSVRWVSKVPKPHMYSVIRQGLQVLQKYPGMTTQQEKDFVEKKLMPAVFRMPSARERQGADERAMHVDSLFHTCIKPRGYLQELYAQKRNMLFIRHLVYLMDTCVEYFLATTSLNYLPLFNKDSNTPVYASLDATRSFVTLPMDVYMEQIACDSARDDLDAAVNCMSFRPPVGALQLMLRGRLFADQYSVTHVDAKSINAWTDTVSAYNAFVAVFNTRQFPIAIPVKLAYQTLLTSACPETINFRYQSFMWVPVDRRVIIDEHEDEHEHDGRELELYRLYVQKWLGVEHPAMYYA